MLVDKKKFSDFTYSKKDHFKLFDKYIFDLFDKGKKNVDTDLKYYQDLLVFLFIKENFSKDLKILEIGGGNSRILNYFKDSCECWNLDKFEGVGNGPLKANEDGIKVVRDYIGDFSDKLQNEYFDLVFSISVFEHIPQDNAELFNKISDDIKRLLNPGGLSIHCIDSIFKEKDKQIWLHPFVEYLFDNKDTINQFISKQKIIESRDLYVMSEVAYNRFWKGCCKKEYEDFGKPFSYNVLWQK